MHSILSGVNVILEKIILPRKFSRKIMVRKISKLDEGINKTLKSGKPFNIYGNFSSDNFGNYSGDY